MYTPSHPQPHSLCLCAPCPTVYSIVLCVLLVLLVCSLCSSLVFLAVFMLLLVVWAPCAPCLFLVLFACILGGFHAPPCRVSSLCSLPVPCALRLYFRRYSCSFILQARGRPLQIAVARSDSSSGCAVTRPHPSPQFLKGPQEALAEQLGRHCVCGLAS